jgi:UDP-N-acetylmuramoylalanine--D-glutamate ligase
MTPAEVQGKQVTVVGGARSGLAVAKLLATAGADVFLTERDAPEEGLTDALDAAGVAYEFGGHTRRALDADFFVVSPGVPSTINLVQQAQRLGLVIYSEIEAASWFCEAPIVAITGTNGKTTTTSLTGHVFRTAADTDPAWRDRDVIVAGNIGYPISDYVLDTDADDVVVMEVSSFQLDHIDTFHPRVSVLLNITPDHLDRYQNKFERYAQSKFRIFENLQAGDTLVYNHDDEVVRTQAQQRAARRDVTALGFSLEQEVRAGAFLRDHALVFRINDQEETLMQADDVALRGRHNLYNSLAAAVAARVMEVRSDVVRESLASFEGVPHRLELVRNRNGVRFVNDSKATNVNAMWYALESYNSPVVLIAGGRDKGNDYAAIKPLIREKVRAVIAIGESADTVLREIGTLAPDCDIATSMEDAIQKADRIAKRGDVVLLSPACSSFDMFENYEDRGDTFRRLVMRL